MSRFDFAYDEVQTAFMELTGADTSDVGASMVANEEWLADVIAGEDVADVTWEECGAPAPATTR
jgi:hypothetical protein